MKSKTIAILMILLIASMGGCIKKTGMEGTYRCEVDDGVLDLLKGGQWELVASSASFGEYSVLHNTVRLKLTGCGVLIPFKIDGRDLIDPDGDHWVRD